jgi:RHS repeat-associated protein
MRRRVQASPGCRALLRQVAYTYDPDGNEVAMTDASGSSSFLYDPFSELVQATDGNGRTVSYGYNALGEETSVTYPLGSGAAWASSDTVGHGYDDAGNMTSVSDFNATATTITDTADALPNSMSLGGSGATLSTSYDATDAPSSMGLTKSFSTLLGFSYSRSPSGAVATETDTPSSSLSPAGYAYDPLSRVTQMTPGTSSALNYSYDASSNLETLPTGATTSYNDAGELTSSTLSSTTTTYSYDADGQLTAATGSTSTDASTAWNGAGELTSYSDASADTSSATYDGDGLRTSATTTPTGGSESTQNFVWDPTSSVPRLLMDSTNAYVYGPSGTPIEQVNLSTGTVTYLVSDALGSVRGVLSSSGSLTASTSYDAYGNPETTGGLSADTPFGFAGGYTDPTGLVYLIGRYYDPQTGQLLSVDPELEQTQQAYAYTQDDPVNTVDPSGRVTVPPGAVTAAKAAYAAGFRALLVDMVAIAGAESGWEPYVTNGRYFGLWQLDIVTFSQPLYPGSKTILCRGITSDWRKPDANARCAFNLTIFNRDNGFPVFSQWYDPIVVDGHKQVNKTATAPGCGDKVCYVIAEAAAKRAGH